MKMSFSSKFTENCFQIGNKAALMPVMACHWVGIKPLSELTIALFSIYMRHSTLMDKVTNGDSCGAIQIAVWALIQYKDAVLPV